MQVAAARGRDEALLQLAAKFAVQPAI
jgi:hypothetical protein